ncbi:MAG: hypothetical protein CMH83_21815 [Nocardioides sp.]|nr:hypothetical protein [Nocardioides sp.]
MSVRSPVPPSAPVGTAAAGVTRGSGELGLGTAVLYLLVVGVSFLQQPGLTTYDTRAELTERPGDFLRGAFTLWHPETNLGELQNQAYGYLFPQGLFFWLLDGAGLPGWVTQRLWTALVLLVAIEGARRVSGALGLGGAAGLVAGLVYGFAPRVLGTVGVLTAETLPGALLPWAVLPVLLVVAGRLRPWRGMALSGAAVVCMGGVNAVEVAGSLPLVVLLVWWGVRRGRLTRRAGWAWAGVVSLACVWWALPLLVLAGYAPRFYEYVESAADTTVLVGWGEAVRGASHWVAYLLVGDQAWWPAAHDLVSVAWLVVLTAVVAAFGFWGLARLEHPARTPLLLGAVLGLAALTVAHGGPGEGLLAGEVRHLLDGPLQIFRNVHKIDPTVRLPLAIGAAQGCVLLSRAVAARGPRLAQVAPTVVVLPLAAVLALGQPWLVDHGRSPGWEAVSSPWREARAYLSAHDDGRATLVVPGSGFALQTWGWTLDEPLVVTGGTRMVTRSQVPLVPGQSLRFLDALDQLVSTGRATPALGDQLSRAGIGHVLVRRDLLRDLTRSPHPSGASVSLARAGLRRVGGWGEVREGGQEVELLEVTRAMPEVRTTALDDVRTVRGAPETVLGLQDTGLVDPGQATVLEGEPGWDRTADVVTDGDQRRERAFGSADEAVSAVLGADEPYRIDRAVHDYPAVDGAEQVVAAYDGLDALTASSAQGYADNFGPVVPQAGPYAAVDGDPETRWITSAATDPEDQWLRLDLAAPTPVTRVRVLPVADDPQVVPVRTLEVRAGGQVRRVDVDTTGAPAVVRFDGTPVDRVEVRVVRAATAARRARVGLREVTVSGVRPTRSLVLPGEVPDDGAWLVGTTAERRACVVVAGPPDCSVARIRPAEEGDGMDRTVTTEGSSDVVLRGRVVARSTRAAGNLLDRLTQRQVGASSVYGEDPRVGPRFAYDGEATTAWVSSPDDPSPTLFVRFARPQTISGLRLGLGLAGAPAGVLVRSEDEVRAVDVDEVDSRGGVRFKPLRGTFFSVSFDPAAGRDTVAVSELDLRGVRLTRRFDPSVATGAVCGLGPAVEIDGEVVATRVSGTMGDVLNGSPLTIESCDPDAGSTDDDAAEGDAGDEGLAGGAAVTVGAGEHRVRTTPSAEFQVVELAAVPADLARAQVYGAADVTADAGAVARAVTTTTWGDTERRVQVAQGESALLWLPESFNPGWRAEVDGEPLTALRVDGWQQGWVLPASADPVDVDLVLAPQRTWTAVLVAGPLVSGAVLLAGLAALLLALVGAVRGRGLPRETPPGDWGTARPWSPGRPRARAAVATLAALGLGVLLGPAFGLGVLATALVVRRSRARERAAAGAALVAAVAIVSSALLDVLPGPGWMGAAGDVLAAAAVGVVVGAVVVTASLGTTAARGSRGRRRAGAVGR